MTDNFQEVIDEWLGGKVTVGELNEKYQLTDAEGFAIAEYARILPIDILKERIKKLEYSMASWEIRSVMEGGPVIYS